MLTQRSFLGLHSIARRYGSRAGSHAPSSIIAKLAGPTPYIALLTLPPPPSTCEPQPTPSHHSDILPGCGNWPR